MASAIEKARASTAKLRAKFTGTGARAERVGTAFLAGAGVAALEMKGTIPAVIMGLPAKPVLAAIALAVASRSGGQTQRFADNAAAGIAGAYGYTAVKQGTLIAGEDSESEDEALGL